MLELVLLVAGALATLAISFFAGKRDGTAKGKVEMAELKAAQAAKVVEKKQQVQVAKNEVEKSVAAVDDDGVVERLRNEWSRD